MTEHAFLVPAGEIFSDRSEEVATQAHLLPNEVRCERVVFASGYDFPEDEPQGYVIPLRDLRRDPAGLYRHLAAKRTRPDHRPATELLQAALSAARQAPVEAQGSPGRTGTTTRR